MNALVDKYIKYIEGKQLSKNTLDGYRRDLLKYIDFVKERDEDINIADEITINAYIQSRVDKKFSNSSINRSIVAIRNFYKFLYSKGYIHDSPIIYYELPKIKTKIPKTLTIEEVERLLDTPDVNTYKGLRDKTMLEIMYATGMKVSELLNLTLFDVNIKEQYIKCKGNKDRERMIPLGTVAIRYIEDYMVIRGKMEGVKGRFLFFNSRGEKMTRQGFWKIVKEYAKEAKIDKDINLYTLRHSFAVHLLENGADIRSLQELLGHVDLSATQKYSYITKKNKLAEVYKNSHPRA
ncbi:site-specific tyrosine recombinase XerD [Clostridium hydrogeniformans]|uniref:site-specific tyrosine recombinase XerD n=1 Tax=Clostridium hydrogeniformans TaxID=349933 RepID=UPI0004841A67|nr:site-specific tyrosine recombinase XerD [Clostridium hydrogeniformans]